MEVEGFVSSIEQIFPCESIVQQHDMNFAAPFEIFGGQKKINLIIGILETLRLSQVIPDRSATKSTSPEIRTSEMSFPSTAKVSTYFRIA